ncbi:phage tail assembly protein [Leisingera sp. HS039]|uniref:phage tail assembly protein n=1 Tax=Leisingera sp. HS039 TaxID=2818496 RepID=UPI001B3A2EE4|nr:phage tail assembly protein [Leisingera sp. HS039]MBQ4826548.1 phage tail assembly protein [Leisingera sp. HS039]
MKLPIEVPLKRPFTFDGETFDKLTFDEPSIGAQIDYADFEVEQGLEEIRLKAELVEDPVERAKAIPAKVSMLVNLFWIEALSGLPKGAGRLIKESDQAAVQAAVDAILSGQSHGGTDDDAAGNAIAAK